MSGQCKPTQIPGTFIVFEIIIHVLILFSFLTFFYKLKASQIETKKVSCELRNMTYAQTMDMLRKADTRSQREMFKEIFAGNLKTTKVFPRTTSELQDWVKAHGVPKVYADRLANMPPLELSNEDTDIIADKLADAMGLSAEPHGIQRTLAAAGTCC